MDKNIFPRPWKEDTDGRSLFDANGKVITMTTELGQYMIQCVNEHDSLVTERDKYRRMLINLCDLSILKGVWKDETLKVLGLLDGEDGEVDGPC